MEFCAQELLHSILVLYHLLNDAHLCAYTGTGEGLEDGGLLLDWFPDYCTGRGMDLQEVGGIWLLTSRVEPFIARKYSADNKCLDSLDILHNSRVGLRAASAAPPATNYGAYCD